MIRTVCFDLGRVVVRICNSWREGVEAAGLPYHDIVDAPENASARRDAVHAHELGRISCEEYFDQLAKLSRGAYTPAEIDRVHRAWLLGEQTGVREIVEELARLGYETGCLSNTNASHWDQLGERHEDGAPRFPAFAALALRVGSHAIGSRKPDPESFQRFAATTTGAETAPPESILFFDDLEANVTGARACGWDAVWIDPEREVAPQITATLGARGIRVR